MGFRRNRILLTTDYLGRIKSCLVGAGIGFVCSVLCYGVVASALPSGSYLTFGNYGLIAAIGVLFSLVGTIVGWGVSRFRFGSVKGAALAAFLWPAIVFLLPVLWMFVWTLVPAPQHTPGLESYERGGVVLISWLYLLPLVTFFLPAAVVAGAMIPWAIVNISWWNADRLR